MFAYFSDGIKVIKSTDMTPERVSCPYFSNLTEFVPYGVIIVGMFGIMQKYLGTIISL